MDQRKVVTVDEDQILNKLQKASELVASRVEDEYPNLALKLAKGMRKGLL
jgi:hypothetical protein